VATTYSPEPQPAPPAQSPTPRRVATPRWLDVRVVLGVVLVLGSVLLGATLVSRADSTYTVAAAGRDLAAGTVLTAADVRLVHVRLPAHGRGTYVQTTRDAVGKTLRRDVSAGELLPVDAVAKTAPHTTITVTLAQGAAPDLRAGQRITVWLSTKACPSVVLLPDVAVQSVRRDDSGSFGSGTGGQDVVVDVAPDVAQRVVTALSSEDATLRAGVLSGHAATTTTTLPDLSSCLPADK